MVTGERHTLRAGGLEARIVDEDDNVLPMRGVGVIQVRGGGALKSGHRRETFAVAVESNAFEDRTDARRIRRAIAHEVFLEVDFRPRNVVVLAPGTIPKTPSGKLRRAHASALVGG
jgi:fatty-acyl-CoA synthase